MRLNMVGAFKRNFPFGTEIAFAKGLRQLGVEVNEIDPSFPGQTFWSAPDATIVFKNIEQSQYREALKEIGGHKIVYQPDDVAFPHIQWMMEEMRKLCDFAFMYDTRGVLFAQKLGYLKAERLLLVADPELYRPLPGTERDIDVCFVGSLSQGPNHLGRMRMCELVMRNCPDLHKCFLGDVYDIEKLVQIYNRSKIVLNHATDVGQPFGHGYGLQCRHFEAGMTGACVLSNVVDNLEDGDPFWFAEFEDQEDLIIQIRDLLSRPEKMQEFREKFYKEMMESHSPINRARQIVKFVEGLDAQA